MNIAIIGAGISGIAMAKELSKNNINIDIFEKAEEEVEEQEQKELII